MREADIERKLCEEVKKLGGIAFKWVSPGNIGVPDRIVMIPGQPDWFVELKTDKGRLSMPQERQIARLEKLGRKVYVLKGEAGLKAFLELLQGGGDEVCTT